MEVQRRVCNTDQPEELGEEAEALSETAADKEAKTDGDDKQKKRQQPKKQLEPTSAESSAISEGPHRSSTNAYILVYRRVLAQGGVNLHVFTMMRTRYTPETLVQEIHDSNQKSRADLAAYKDQYAKEAARLEEHKATYLSTIQNAVPKPGEKFRWIETEALRRWVRGDLPICGEFCLQERQKSLRCEHGKLKPLPRAKCISVEAWSVISKNQESENEFDETSSCSACAQKLCLYRLAELKRIQRDYTTLILLDEEDSTDKPNQDKYWISKEWTNEIKSKSTTKRSVTIQKDIEEWVQWIRRSLTPLMNYI